MNVKKQIKLVIVEFLILGLIAGSIWAVIVAVKDPSGFYVTPGGKGSDCSRILPCSLETARDKVRTINQGMEEDITIWLAGGTYTLNETFTLDSRDSGSNGHDVIYQALPGADPVLSGGQQVTGWKLADQEKNIYAAPVPAGSQFRQLYINGSRAIRARTPNLEDQWTLGPYYAAMNTDYPLQIDADRISDWEHFDRVEMVWLAHWHHRRARLESYTVDKAIATVFIQSPEKNNPDPKTGPLNHCNQVVPVFFFENSRDFLDAAGEWYLDTSENMLYVIPNPGQDITTASVVVPRLENLVNIEGADHIQFSGLTFQYTNWTEPNDVGYLSWQGALQLYTNGNQPLPGAVQLKSANHIIIHGCTFEHLGAHGLVTFAPAHDNQILRNTFTDLAAGGIVLNATITQGTVYNELIRDNLVDSYGQDYTEAVGILATLVSNTTITHNEVRNGRYTGISIGWSWDDLQKGAFDNVVSYNYIHDVMKLHADGAGIYTLGRMDNTIIHHNYIANIVKSRYQGESPIVGIYLDNGSVGKTVEHNVMLNTIHAFYALNKPNHNNIIINNFYTGILGDIDPKTLTQNNTSFVETNIPQAALDIIQTAGIGNIE